MRVARSVVDDALFNVVNAAYPWAYSSKHLQMFSNTSYLQPAMFIRRVNEDISQKAYGLNKYVLTYEIWVYLQVNWQDPAADIYDQTINPVMDAIDAAFYPNTPQGSFTMGGVVDNARISGKADIADGSTDGQALIVVPVEVFTC